jgi:branched-chain amino acid transport system ATP-binding protein
MSSELLRVDDLHCDFGGVHAVNGAAFSIGRSVITGLIGPNGAGKSTVLNAIAGFIKPSSGSIIFDGQHIAGLPSHRVARHGVIRTFQLPRVFGRMTVLENLLVSSQSQKGESLWGALLGERYWGDQDRRAIVRARALLKEFRLADKESDLADTLSGGQKRILEIARSLMTDPKLLLLDEPMAGVSPTHRGLIIQHLEDLRDRGLAILMTEHQLESIERLCAKVVVMAQGKIISQGAMHEVRLERAVQDAYLIG